MMGLTHQQARALDVIRDLTVEGVAPSYEELREALGVSSKSRIFALLNNLEERGAIRRRPNSPRSIEIIAGGGAATVLDNLPALDAAGLREVLAHTVGLLAEREGVPQVASMLHRLGDRLPRRAS